MIGNGQYQTVPKLPNPSGDAEYLATSLRSAGFDWVSVAIDMSRENLVGALHRFASEAEKADWAVIYFAGHGIELGGMNYLIPVDARLRTDRDLQFEAVALTQALAAVEGARKLRLIILDACRDNPFTASMTRTLSATRSIGRGLAQIEPDAGTLVAYAAKHGQVAQDGEGAHSPYVTSLVRHMNTPGLEVVRLFRKVTSDVLKVTNRGQEPFTYGSLPDEDFFFKAAALPIEDQPALASPPARPAAVPLVPPAAAIPTAPAEPATSTVATVPAPMPAPPDLSAIPTAKARPGEPSAAAKQQVANVEARPVAPAAPEPSEAVSKGHALGAKPALIAPRKRLKPAAKPVPARRERVAQHAEPQQVNAPRPRAQSKRGGRCFVFNGERVCE